MTGCAGVTVAWMPPIPRSRDPIFDCGVWANDTVARRRATKHSADFGTVEARLDLNLDSF
jgi:hypothetical protein